MNPEFLDSMSWRMAEVYAGVNDEILINLAHYFPYYKSVDELPRSSFEYQANMLAQMGQVNRDTIRIIRRNLRGADGALKGVLEQTIIDAVAKDNPALAQAVKAGILKPAGIPKVTPNQWRAYDLYYQQSCDKLNLVNTVMLESTQQAYQATCSDIVSRIDATQRAVNISAGETITGVSSWNQAVKHATDRLKANGITGFIDHAGRHWSAEAYVAMDVRTTVYNTARAAVWENNQDFGNDLYMVSWHNGARPLCYDWQNKVVSQTDTARDVTDLYGETIHVYAQSETTYGEAAGLFGINCKHYPTSFIPGVSVIRGEPQSPEENEKTYAESQEQRRLERKLREDKRDLAMLKAQGAPDDVIKAQQEKVRQSSRDIDDFCEQTGRTRQRSREGVYTGRSFPDPHTYDVSTFERNQKDMIDKYFMSGGAQQAFTTGQMTPNTTTGAQQPPQIPTPDAVQNQAVSTFTPAKTREEAEAYAREHFGDKYSTMSYRGIDLEYANTCNRVLTEVNARYDISEYTKWSTLKGIEPMNMRTSMFKGSTSEAAYHWSGNGTLYINPTFYKSPKAFAAHIKEIEDLTAVCVKNGQVLIDTGKYTGKDRIYLETLIRTKRQCVSQSYDFVEGTFVHEAGHMLEDKIFRRVFDEYFGTTGKYNGYNEYLSESRMRYGVNISGYAVHDNREYVAESFIAWWYGETDKLDPNLVRVFEGTRRK